MSVPIHKYSEPETMKELIQKAQDLMPLPEVKSWKGRGIHIGESIRRKFNQLINLFKTGSWSVDRQTMSKLSKDLHELSDMVSKDSDILEKKGPALLKTQLEMRQQIDSRLVLMREVLYTAEEHSKKPEQFAELKREFDSAISINKKTIREAASLLPQQIKIGTAAKQAARSTGRLNERRPHKGGKISEQTKKTLDAKLKRKHKVEVPFMKAKVEKAEDYKMKEKKE
jgi:hypothetical protein